MKTNSLFTWALVGISLMFVSCCNSNSKTECSKKCCDKSEIVLKDYGPAPLVVDIEEYTEGNTNFRTTLWTGESLQVTLMSIPVKGEIGLELHSDIDQFLRIEQGKGKVFMGDKEDELTFVQIVEEDFAVFVPAGKWHNIVNVGDKPLKLYSIYAPVEHPHGTVHKTMEEAIEAEKHHHHH